jgi:hypothetical protein
MAQTLRASPPASPVTILDLSFRPRWSLPRRIAFRLTAAYLILFNLPYQGHINVLGLIPGMPAVAQFYTRGSRALVEWVAAHIFHLTGPVAVYPRVNGSGDTTLDYIQELCLLVFAVVATVVWSILDRRRTDYRRFHAWLRIFVRYSLALTLFGYGFAKVFPLQFVPPGMNRLLEPLNEFSPMGLLWTFMGFSPAYTIFAGAAEVLGGALLLFRATTTLGALVSAAVMLNVVMLNFCYDVPVKLYSANLLFMAIFLAAPEISRLLNVFVLNRTAPPSRIDAMLFRSRRAQIAIAVLKTVFIGATLFMQIKGGIAGYRRFYVDVPKPPLYGIWDVESFTRSGELVTNGSRWNRVVMERPQLMQVRLLDGSTAGFTSEYDSSHQRINLKPGGFLNYGRPGDSYLTLEGVLASEPVSMRLRKVDTAKFRLTSRGFHWINETPFNR